MSDAAFDELLEDTTALDEAIAEVERGEVFYYDSVDEMFADIEKEKVMQQPL